MHCGTVLPLLLAIGLVNCAPRIPRPINSDAIYFPDQAANIRLSQRCRENLVLWPGTGKCYREGEQGPCNIGRVLYLDIFFTPRCKDE